GFSALPGGNRNIGTFFDLGNAGYWWCATESSASNAWRRGIYRDQWHVNRNGIPKEIGLSVRCVRD
ncbi:MAG: FISUMP domain-containing protein, partial [Proteiniphilum sp.]